MLIQPIDYFLVGWFVLALASTVYVKAGTSGMTMIRYLRLKTIFTEEMRREAPAK